SVWTGAARSGDLLDALHLRHEVAQEVLDAVLQRRGRRGAARAGALHVQEDGAVLEAAEGYVAAVLGHRRAHARVEQLLDGDDDLLVGRVVELLAGVALVTLGVAGQHRVAGHGVLHDAAAAG